MKAKSILIFILIVLPGLFSYTRNTNPVKVIGSGRVTVEHIIVKDRVLKKLVDGITTYKGEKITLLNK